MSDINKLLQIRSNKIPPIPGRILIAEPLTEDALFSRSVIYLISNNATGTFGLILNKLPDNALWNINSPFKEIPVYAGGPVDRDVLFFLHTFGNAIPNALLVADGIYCGGDWNRVEEMAKENLLNNSNFKMFWGYAGWVSNQLNTEIANNIWAVSDIDKQTIFACPPKDFWQKAVLSLGEKYKHWLIMPSHPDVN